MSKADTRLGKGLGALLGEYLEDTEGGVERQVRVDSIRSNPYQPRTRFADEALQELTESIRQNGLLQPLIVRAADGGWEIVAGERRWRALQKLGQETAPAIVRELNDAQMLVLALVENLQREDLGPLEEAHGYRQLIDQFGLTQQQVGERVGKDRSTVANALRLLALPAAVQRLLAEGKLSGGHGRALLGLEEAEAQVRLARAAVRGGLSVRELERRVRKARDGAGSAAAGGRTRQGARPDPAVRRAEEALQRALGTQVRVVARRGSRGEIRIPFHDADDFERLFELLSGAGSAKSSQGL